MTISPYLQRFSFVLLAAALVMGPIAEPLPVVIAYAIAGLLLAYGSVSDLISSRIPSRKTAVGSRESSHAKALRYW